MAKSAELGMPSCSEKKQGLFLSRFVDDFKMAGKKQHVASMWKKLMKNVELDEPTSFLDHVYFGALNVIANGTNSSISAGATEKLPGLESLHAKTKAWSYDVEGHAQKMR